LWAIQLFSQGQVALPDNSFFLEVAAGRRGPAKTVRPTERPGLAERVVSFVDAAVEAEGQAPMLEILVERVAMVGFPVVVEEVEEVRQPLALEARAEMVDEERLGSLLGDDFRRI
jgi:hypothetical protein